MIYLKWLAMVPVMLAVTALTFPLAFVLPFFAKDRPGQINNGTDSDFGPRLPDWLSWFQTPDNSLDGDQGWRTEHWQWRFKLPTALAIYVGQVGWLWRNPGYGYGAEFLIGEPIFATLTGDKDVNDDPGHEGWCLVRCQDLFQFVWVKRIAANKSIYCVFGWNVKGLVDANQRRHTATFAFSPRISKFTVK